MNEIDEQVNVERLLMSVCVGLNGDLVKHFMPKTRRYSSSKVLRQTIFNDDMQQGTTTTYGRTENW